MPLTLSIDRTEDGLFRAEVAGRPETAIERDDLRELIEALKQTLDMVVLNPDGTLTLIPLETEGGTEEARLRAEVEKTALRNEDLDRLIERYPVPPDWGDEPGWSDDV